LILPIENLNLALVYKFLTRIQLFIQYLIKGRSKYYIHSPFVYDFCRFVLSRKPLQKDSDTINSIIKYYQSKKDILNLQEFGAARKRDYAIKIGDYLNRTAITNKYGRLLHNLVAYYQVEHVIETGTALGISTSWMALSNPNCKISSIEGNKKLCDVSNEMFIRFSITNTQVYCGLVEDVLPELAKNMKCKTLLFIDAHHTGAATMRYFAMIKSYVKDDTIVVFDDINYSAEMNDAWKNIICDERVTLSLNLYRIGVIFFNPSLSKQAFSLYY
jgi:predicted O-methyltransferase YrrM